MLDFYKHSANPLLYNWNRSVVSCRVDRLEKHEEFCSQKLPLFGQFWLSPFVMHYSITFLLYLASVTLAYEEASRQFREMS